MKKTLLLLVIVCVLSVGFAFSADVPYVGEWGPYSDANPPDNGDSTVTMTTDTRDGMTAYTLKGEVSTKFEYGFAGVAITPDAATLASLKTAKGISFKVLGDGKRYTVKYHIAAVRDWAHHEFSFDTKAGEVMTINVPMRMFMQPAWGRPISLNAASQRRAQEVSFQTHEVWRVVDKRTPFEITVWDLRIMQ
jgi:hypothetical protein